MIATLATFSYDALGRRVTQVQGGQTTRFVYDAGCDGSANRCPQCGRYRYSPANDLYVLSSCLTGQPIYEAWLFAALIITLELRARIKPGIWKGIGIMKLPVLDEPQDGITDFPEDWY